VCCGPLRARVVAKEAVGVHEQTQTVGIVLEESGRLADGVLTPGDLMRQRCPGSGRARTSS